MFGKLLTVQLPTSDLYYKGFSIFEDPYIIMDLEKLLNDISKMFDCLNIPYLVTGSLAYNIYSLPRATRDIDVIIELSLEDVPDFIKAIEGNYYFNQHTIYDEVKRRGMFNIIHLHSSYKVDIILRSNDPFEIAKFQRRKQMDLLGNKIYVITLEDLVISKLRWIQQLESELHKRDIISLLQSQDVDFQYIKGWCNKLNLNTFNLIAE